MSTFGAIPQEPSTLFFETASHRAVALAHSSGIYPLLSSQCWDSLLSQLAFTWATETNSGP